MQTLRVAHAASAYRAWEGQASKAGQDLFMADASGRCKCHNGKLCIRIWRAVAAVLLQTSRHKRWCANGLKETGEGG